MQCTSMLYLQTELYKVFLIEGLSTTKKYPKVRHPSKDLRNADKVFGWSILTLLACLTFRLVADFVTLIITARAAALAGLWRWSRRGRATALVGLRRSMSCTDELVLGADEFVLEVLGWRAFAGLWGIVRTVWILAALAFFAFGLATNLIAIFIGRRRTPTSTEKPKVKAGLLGLKVGRFLYVG